MAALAAPRSTPLWGQLYAQRAIPVADNVKIFPGALVVINASGYCEPATAAASKIAAGTYRGTKVLDNTVTGHAAAAFDVPVDMGTFKFINKAGDLVTQALVGAACYIEDDQTVRLTGTGSSAAGKVHRVDSDGVWVSVALPLF